MKLITGTDDIKLNNTVITIGKFDCLHLGHMMLIDVASGMKEPGMQQVIFTFDNNPNDVVNNCLDRQIVSGNERDYRAVKNRVDCIVEYPFTHEVRNMTPKEFVRDILVKKMDARAVVCGDDFRFGYDRTGDADVLAGLGEEYGFRVRIVERIKYKGRAISSTYIRQELLKGNLSDVNEMLGRNFTMTSVVEKGFHIGRKMGLPTINFKISEDKLLPPDGVYITETEIDGMRFASITNIGVRPTFHKDGERLVETYISGFDGNAYGRMAIVHFHEFIRPEIKFAGAGELAQQIKTDLEIMKKYFNKMGRMKENG
ncbi:MAG: bifunctional riboflavin kinase/FAD synthetase [Lachnospiraceae bacterium]|jgi:riboflavin kinase/FMN adenylyltransferase